MVDEPATSRRVAVLELVAPGADSAEPSTDSVGQIRESSMHLLSILSEVADAVRTGRYHTSHREGILVDTIVGDTRCLLIVQEPTQTVKLSPREQEIARMVAAGRTNHAIAGALDISVWTVSTHLRRIFAKLAVGSRAEMVAHLLGQREIRVTPEHDPKS